jgi:hypothetical protein
MPTDWLLTSQLYQQTLLPRPRKQELRDPRAMQP